MTVSSGGSGPVVCVLKAIADTAQVTTPLLLKVSLLISISMGTTYAYMRIVIGHHHQVRHKFVRTSQGTHWTPPSPLSV